MVQGPRGCPTGPHLQRPERYFVPPYVGRHGWLGVRLDRPVDRREVEALIEYSYRLTAPRRLIRSL